MASDKIDKSEGSNIQSPGETLNQTIHGNKYWMSNNSYDLPHTLKLKAVWSCTPIQGAHWPSATLRRCVTYSIWCWIGSLFIWLMCVSVILRALSNIAGVVPFYRGILSTKWTLSSYRKKRKTIRNSTRTKVRKARIKINTYGKYPIPGLAATACPVTQPTPSLPLRPTISVHSGIRYFSYLDKKGDKKNNAKTGKPAESKGEEKIPNGRNRKTNSPILQT